LTRLAALAVTALLAASLFIGSTTGTTGVSITKGGRSAIVNKYGIATVTDALTLSNDGLSPIDSLDFGFPKSHSGGLELFEARGSAGESLRTERVENQSSPTQWWKCHFAKPLAPGGTSDINIRTVFSNLVSYDGKEYIFSFAAYPTLPFGANSYNSTVILQKDAVFREWPNKTFTTTKVEERPALIGVQIPLEPFSNIEIPLKFTDAAQELLTFRSLKREIMISPGGQTSSKDTYTITNRGSELSSLTIPRPKNMSPIMLYDTAGPLNERLRTQEDSLSITPRFGKMTQDASYTFTTEYNMPTQGSLSRLEWSGRYRMTAELHPAREFAVGDDLVNITLPSGSKIETISIPPNSTSTLSDGSQVMTYHFGRLPPASTETTAIEYDYPIFLSSIYPLQWVFSLEVIVGAFAAAVLLRRPQKVVAAAPAEKLRKFVDLQDEKRTLRLELEKGGNELARGAMTKHDYRKRRRLIETRISELNKTLTSLKSELRNLDPRYEQMARRLEKAEGEVDALRASEEQITGQYRSGRISKDVYESLVKDLRKRIEKAKQTVDSLIVTLREESR